MTTKHPLQLTCEKAQIETTSYLNLAGRLCLAIQLPTPTALGEVMGEVIAQITPIDQLDIAKAFATVKLDQEAKVMYFPFVRFVNKEEEGKDV